MPRCWKQKAECDDETLFPWHTVFGLYCWEMQRFGENDMRWIEIVHVRSLDGNERISSILSHYSTKEIGSEPGLVEVNLYKDASFDGDMSFIFVWDTDHPEHHGSRFALSLSHSMKTLGLIKHSVWVEQKINSKR